MPNMISSFILLPLLVAVWICWYYIDYQRLMNPKGYVDRSKQMFDLDSDVSDEEVNEVADKNAHRRSQTIEGTASPILETLYEENHQKYISYLDEFATMAEQAEADIFSDGATYVTHPLIEMTQVVRTRPCLEL